MNPNKFQRGQRPQKERKHKINGEVRFPQVRLIGDGEPQILSSFDAAKIAESMEMDLILINENQTPPIVKIGDYNKFIYDLEKAEKDKKKNAQRSETKEIQLSCDIHEHDLQTKARKGREFLEDNDKIKVVIQLKGRQKATPERGEIVMLRFAEILNEVGVPEAMPRLEGGRWNLMIKPKK